MSPSLNRASQRGKQVLSLTTVICVTETSQGLERLVAQLDRSSGPELVEILVVHNGENAPGPEYARVTGCPRARLIASSPGLSNARNAGLLETRTELVAFLDQDLRVSEGWSRQIVATFRERPEVSALGGEVLPEWPGPKPDWLDPVIEAALSVQRFHRRQQLMGPFQYLVGANLVFRSDHLRLVGGFPSYLGRVGTSLLSNEELVPQKKFDELGLTRLGSKAFFVHAPIPRDRLSREWLVRRFTWQAVSDSLSGALSRAQPAEFSTPTNLSTSSRELTDLRLLVRNLLDGTSPDLTNGNRETTPPWASIDARQRDAGGIRLIEFESGGHIRLAHRWREILSARLTILDGNPWSDKPSETIARLLEEMSRAVNAGERVLVVTADPLLRRKTRPLFEESLRGGLSTHVRFLVHRLPKSSPLNSASKFLEGVPGALTLLRVVSSPKDTPNGLQGVIHPIMSESGRSIPRAVAKEKLGIPDDTVVITSIGSHLHKNVDTVLDALVELSAISCRIHFLFVGAARQEHVDRLDALAQLVRGRITNLLRVPEDEFRFETIADSEVEIAFQASDVGLILGGVDDYFPSTALEYLQIHTPLICPDELSWSIPWEENGVATRYRAGDAQSLFSAVSDTIESPRPRVTSFRRATGSHRDSSVRASLLSALGEG